MLYRDFKVKELEEYYGMKKKCYMNSVEGYKIKDCEKIQKAFSIKDIHLTIKEVEHLYSNFSDKYCAEWDSWIRYENNYEEIYDMLLPWLKLTINDRIDRLTKISDEIGDK